jgi:hypothetical protein
MSVQQAIAAQVKESDYITFSYEGQTYRYTHPGLDTACKLNQSHVANKEESYNLPYLPSVLLHIFVDFPDFIIGIIDTFIQIMLMFPEKDPSMPDNNRIFKGCVYHKKSDAVLQFTYEVTN